MQTPSVRFPQVLASALLLGFAALACNDSQANDDSADVTEGDGDGDGDPSTGDGDPGTGDGDPSTGDGDPSTGDGDGDPADPAGLTPLAASMRSCALDEAGVVRCWGLGRDGQLGDGIVGEGHEQLSPTAVVGVDAVLVDLSGDAFHSCVVTEAGEALCFGTTFTGALGTSTLEATEPTPVPVAGLTDVAQIDCGSNFTCARAEDGGVWCWGAGASGRLGNGTTDDTATPVEALITGASDVSTGSDHACALVDGQVWCWGSNVDWQLGDSDPGSFSLEPFLAPDLPAGLVDVETGSGTTCAIDGSGGLWCWGRNDSGELGLGSEDPQEITGGQVELPAPVLTVSLGYRVGCAIVEGGAVYCWGLGDLGQLGDGQSGVDHRSATPVPVTGLAAGARRISVGRTHVCATTDDDQTWCWGSGADGELGDGSTEDGHFSAVPVQVMGL